VITTKYRHNVALIIKTNLKLHVIIMCTVINGIS